MGTQHTAEQAIALLQSEKRMKNKIYLNYNKI
jgi:hypothetical protein